MKLDPRTRKIRRWKTEPAGGRDAGMRKDGCGEFESQSIPTCQLWSHLPPFTSRIHRALPPTPEQTNSTHNSQRPPSQRSAGKFSHQPFSQMEKAPSERNGRTLTNQRNHNRSNKKKASPTPTTPGSFHISTLPPPSTSSSSSCPTTPTRPRARQKDSKTLLPMFYSNPDIETAT